MSSDARQAGGLTPTEAADLGPNAVPDRIAIDAKGYGWRVWDDQPDMWSMVPQNPDNSPIPKPLTWFVRANSQAGSSYDADARCPKCGHDDVATTYRQNGHEYACRDHRRGLAGDGDACEVCRDEHFDRTCRRCSYAWREEVA